MIAAGYLKSVDLSEEEGRRYAPDARPERSGE